MKRRGYVYPGPKGCLMIFGGPVAYESKHWQKLTAREVNAAALGEAAPVFLKWSKTTITIDRKDHPDHIPQPGHFPLVVDPIIGKTHLSHVLMDGRRSLNLLCAKIYDAIGLLRVVIRPSSAPFHGVIRGLQAIPLGQVDLPVTFGDRANFRMKTLTFKIVDFPSTYHAILG
jgi:hypothetical protein